MVAGSGIISKGSSLACLRVDAACRWDLRSHVGWSTCGLSVDPGLSGSVAAGFLSPL